MNETYGTKGCVHRLEQRKHLKFPVDGLDQTPNHDSFDVEFSVTGQVLQEITFNYGGATFRSTRFEYDEAGRLTRTVESDNTGAEVAFSERVYSEGRCTWINRDSTGMITSHGVDEYNGEYLVLLSTFDGKVGPRGSRVSSIWIANSRNLILSITFPMASCTNAGSQTMTLREEFIGRTV